MATHDCSSDRPVKIAVAGTHSTGKTTFLTRLRHLLETAGYHISTVGDQAAGARDHGFPILREQTGTTTLWIMTMGIAAELAAGRRDDVVLVDRPITDALAYHTAAHAWRGEPVDPMQAAFLTDLARHHAPSYHLIYRAVVDPDLGIADDGHRDTDPAYRDLVDRAITTVYARLNIPTVPLQSVDHTTAVRHALQLARRAITPPGIVPA
jgi:GTPase SAR1 family protein